MRATGVGPRLGLVVAFILILCPLAALVTPPAVASAPAEPFAPAATSVRRVNVRPSPGPTADAWATASVFWFGRATNTDNYVDVRVAYDSQALYVLATVADYYLWWDRGGGADPRQYDALAVYLDTSGDRAAAPQPDDYLLVSGLRFYVSMSDPRWRRQARGTGSGWNEAWAPSPAWSDGVSARWYSSGPNGNSDLDAGWTTTLTIPWATLGRAGPPSAGTVWGLGAVVYDRDDRPPAGGVPPKAWPEGFAAGSPATWGALAFDPPAYKPPPAIVQGTTSIRRGLNGAVEDAYAGGGGNCLGGRFGGGDAPHPTGDLFVQNQGDVADFPCFSKSYLKFDLGAIPPGKAIVSATLQVYEFGSSDPSRARPSLVQLFSVADPWGEATLTWNNAPLAAENLGGTWVNPTAFPGWPGIKVTWDATRLVADAYAAGRPASLALYSADMAYHSGKYFSSSDVGDWDAAGRPTLIVTWGKRIPDVAIQVGPAGARQGDILTYSVAVTGSGRPLRLDDPLPAEVDYVQGSATGGATYDAAAQAIRWSGTLDVGQEVTLTYRVRVTTAAPTVVTNTATVADDLQPPVSATARIIVNGHRVLLPLVSRGR